MREVDVTNGEAELLTARISDRNGADISSATFTLGLGTHDDPPAVFVAPTTTASPSPSVRLVSLMVNNPAQKSVDPKYLWAKMVDAGETLIVRVSSTPIAIV
jgi:hypothetical protein